MEYKSWEELTIQDDYMFKLIMRRKRICRAMLETILDIKIRDIEYVEAEKSIQADFPSHGVRLDVYVEDDIGTVYNIEMQVKHPGTEHLARRTRYYQSMLDTSLLAAGTDYEELNDSYIIFICPFDPIGAGRHIYTFRPCCLEDMGITLPDGATRVFLNASGTADDVRPEVKAFLNYVNGVVSDDRLVQDIETEIRQVKATKDERVGYMTYLLKMQDERKEGRKEGKLANMIDCVKSLMKNMNLSAEQAFQALNINDADRKAVLAALN